MARKLDRSTERIFWFPFLMLLKENGEMITSNIIKELRNMLQPKGHDSEIINGRSDDYFSQKIRNIKSHQSLDKYVFYDELGNWRLNDDGLIFIDNNSDVVDQIYGIVSNTSFDYFDKITFIDLVVLPFFPRRKSSSTTISRRVVKKVIFYDENVSEGKISSKTVIIRERSRKLREKAIEHFSDASGNIGCCICGFEFNKAYGEYGKGYIEIHHKKPVYQYEDKDINTVLIDALENLVPVCANCHRMLHHKKGISFEEVEKIYNDNK